MKGRFLIALVCLLVTLATAPGIAHAQSVPGFRLGFRAIADQIPAIVGEPLENEHSGPNGDSLQRTATGLMVWRKADNWMAFTDGDRTWVNGPNGLQERPNDERFSWEKDGTTQAATPVPTQSLSTHALAPFPYTSAPQQSYTPVVRAMDEEAVGPGAMVADYLHDLDARWATVWGWRPRQPVTVYLYFDGYRMAEGVASISGLALVPTRRDEIATTMAGLKVRDSQTGGWAILMNLNRYYGTDRWAIRAKHLLTHEYTHVMQSDLAGVAGPTWFHEGMAEYTAFAEVPEALSFLDRTKYVIQHRDQGDLPSLRYLQESWREMIDARDDRAQLAYGMSYVAVKYLADRIGGTPLLQVLERTAAGQDFEAALETTTGYNLDRLDAEYRQGIPTSSARP